MLKFQQIAEETAEKKTLAIYCHSWYINEVLGNKSYAFVVILNI